MSGLGEGVAATTAPVLPAMTREWPWLGLGGLAIAALILACGHAPLGTPVLDDYRFLDTLRFHPISWFDSMGWEWYWRPVSRQLYFLAVGPWLLAHSLGVVALHAAILLALYATLYRIARAACPPPVAMAVASFPMLGEPMRVLLTWASGSQYLLAMLGVSLAVERALAGRKLGAALGMLLALLSHESTLLALPLLPAIAALRAQSAAPASLGNVSPNGPPGPALRGREVLAWGLLALGLGAAWLAGLWIALAHGLSLLPLPHGVFPARELPTLFARCLAAQLNLEGFPPRLTGAFAAGYAALLIAALVLLARRREARARLAPVAIPLATAAAWFCVYTFPLVYLEPGWAGWRSALPGLGLAILAPVLLGAASPWLAIGLVVVRIAALGLATPPPAVVTPRPPTSVSYLSYARLVRLQRLVDSTRRALLARYPTLPRRAVVRYWNMPQGADWAFQKSRALRVWYGDSTLTWDRFGGQSGLDQRVDALVAYNSDRAAPAVVIEPAALRLFLESRGAFAGGRMREADSLLAATLLAQREPAEPLALAVLQNQVRVALARGDLARAQALNEAALEREGESARYYVIAARLAIARGDPAAAEEALRKCLTLEPGNPEGEEIARGLGLIR